MVRKLILLIVVFLVGCGSFGWWYWHRHWPGQGRFTVITIGPQVNVATLDPAIGMGISFNLPPTLEIETIAGRGTWQIQSLAQVGSPQWAADSVADYLGVAYTSNNHDLNLWDKLAWWWQSRQVKWQDLDLTNTSVLSKATSPDGVKVLKLNALWDSQARDWFADYQIAKQGYSAVVINTTTTPGLGSRAARVLENIGIKVIEVSNAPTLVAQCLVKTQPDLKHSLVVKTLVAHFNCQWEQTDRSEIELVLGEDY